MPTILPITDFLDPQLDIYARLSENQLLNRCDPQNGIFIAESPKVIERALDAGCIPISFLTEDRHLENQAVPFLERCPDIPFFSAPFEVLTQLTGFALTRGMLCAMRRPRLPSVEALCRTSSRLVILENIMNPTNIGAIFRSAAALGMDGVLLLAFVLGFPANEIVLPIAVMGYLAQGSLGDSLGLAQMHALLTANGWTWTTAVSAVLFFLLHWPCSTTLWTIRRETGSTKWTLLAALLPTAMGMALCTAFTALARALGW